MPDSTTHLPCRRHRLRRWAWAFPGLALFWALAVAGKVVQFGGIDQATAPVSAIVVLGAGVEKDRPSPVFEARIRHGIDLYRRGLAPVIVFTGGLGAGEKANESEVARAYALADGLPAGAILTETRSETTRQNLEEAGRVMDAAGLERRIILVSDPYHLLRASWMAKRLGFAVFTSPTPHTRFETWETKIPFLLREVYFLHHFAVFGR